MAGILRLESLTKGNTLKQGDLTLLKYRLFDADGDKLDISGKSATVRLMKNDFTFIAYEKEGLTVAPDDTISFNVNKILPGGLYHLEIIVDDKYIFPSRADEGKFNVDKSSLGAELTIIENTGIDAVVKKAVDLINEDPSLIIDEDKLISEIIANTSVGSIEEYYQEYRDAIQEYADLKPKALSAVSKSEEALTKSQNALNVANGIDAKATEALSKSNDADALSKSVQSQFNQVVIDGDSSVEAAQARVDASGHANPTLKARLDKEHNEVTAQLAQTERVFDVLKMSQTEDIPSEMQTLINKATQEKYRKFILPHGVLNVTNQSYNIPSNLSVIGNNTTLLSDGVRENPLFIVDGENITIEGIEFDFSQLDLGGEQTVPQSQSAIVLDGDTFNISIKNNTFKRGYAGVWVHPQSRGEHRELLISDNVFTQLNHYVHLGINSADTTNRVDKIVDVKILNNYMGDGYANSDGVKTIQNVKNVLIQGNTIENMKRDAIDLYTSGENVVIIGNILRNNEQNGIDIKDRLDTTFPTEFHGYNRNMVISNNIIEDNVVYGVGIASGGVYGISVTDNIFRGNITRAISVHGRHIVISKNQIFNNNHIPNDVSGAIHLYKGVDVATEHVTITDNLIFNNGVADNECYGLKIASECNHIIVSGNVITNDELRPNAHQKCGLFVIGTARDIKVGKNSISGHGRNVWIKQNAGIDGIKTTLRINGQENPTGSYDVNNLILQGNSKRHIVDLKISFILPSATEHYFNFRLRKAVDSVLNTSSIATVNTQGNTTSYTPFIINQFADGSITQDYRELKENEYLVLNVQSVGGGVAVSDIVVEVNYIES